MRLLATGDWQAGVTTLALDDQEQVWHRMVDVALERKVDTFLHGGDLYHGPTVSMEQVAAVRRVFNRLREAGIPILVIRGNGSHDLAMRPVNALDLFRDYDGITVADSPAVCILADKVAVCTLPWVHPGRLIASMNGSLTHEDADLTTAQMLVRIAEHLHRKASLIQAGTFGPANLPTVLLAHWAISGSALPTGLPVDEMREPILSWADLDAIGYDAIIGAHIHQPQQISQPLIDRTLGIVVGSPQQLNHGEHGDHGCWIVDVPALAESETDSPGGLAARRPSAGDPQAAVAGGSSGSASAEFVPIESRRFVTIGIGEDELNDVPEGAIVRVRYEATEDEARRIDHEQIRREILDCGASRLTFDPKPIRASRARAETISEQMSHEEAMLAYCKAQELSAAVTAAMLERMKTWGES